MSAPAPPRPSIGDDAVDPDDAVGVPPTVVDPLARLGNYVSAIVAVVVIMIITGVLVLIGIAATAKHPTAGASVVVFTVSAPYDPSDHEVAAPVTVNPRIPAPMGNWTYARGVDIAKRALAWVGWPYSWDAGDASGPTYGQAVDAASRNDAHIRGFDCSGLVLNALAPYRRVDHSASAQYTEAGSFHPALNQLLPGDLIFWSGDGTIGGVGHVAIYIGDGKVVQAPHSGAYVGVVRIDQVEPGKIGVTRPLT